MIDLHVLPNTDLIEHSVDTEADCACGPRLDRHPRADGSDGWVAVHHSLDGREQA